MGYVCGRWDGSALEALRSETALSEDHLRVVFAALLAIAKAAARSRASVKEMASDLESDLKMGPVWGKYVSSLSFSFFSHLSLSL